MSLALGWGGIAAVVLAGLLVNGLLLRTALRIGVHLRVGALWGITTRTARNKYTGPPPLGAGKLHMAVGWLFGSPVARSSVKPKQSRFRCRVGEP